MTYNSQRDSKAAPPPGEPASAVAVYLDDAAGNRHLCLFPASLPVDRLAEVLAAFHREVDHPDRPATPKQRVQARKKKGRRA